MNKFALYPSLKDRCVIITGGATGIGAEIVSAFAGQDCKVGFLDLDEVEGKKLANKLGKNVYFQNCDLRDISGLKLSISKMIDMTGKK